MRDYLLQRFSCSMYKAFEHEAAVDIAPLTLVFGRNNSGKSALVRSPIHLLSTLAQADLHRVPLPTRVKGVKFGDKFADLVHGGAFFSRPVLAAAFAKGPVSATVSWSVFTRNAGARPELWSITRTVGDQRIHQTVDEPELEPLGREQTVALPDDGPVTRFDIEDALNHLHSLGPLRAPLQSSYARSTDTQIDREGRGAAQALDGDPALETAVSARLSKCIGGDPGLRVVAEGESFHLQLTSHGLPVNAAFAGQGIHQLLPVVVLCERHRRSGDSSMLVIEQPELHLHDAAQAPLGDLLLDAALEGRGPVLVESHSEALLLRVRRRIAEGVSPENVAVYFVDGGNETNKVRRIQIKADGSVTNWPPGVFLERYEEVRELQRTRR